MNQPCIFLCVEGALFLPISSRVHPIPEKLAPDHLHLLWDQMIPLRRFVLLTGAAFAAAVDENPARVRMT